MPLIEMNELTTPDIEELLNLAIENERLEREMVRSSFNHGTEAERVALLHLLETGLCRASNLARREKGVPSIREENRKKS